MLPTLVVPWQLYLLLHEWWPRSDISIRGSTNIGEATHSMHSCSGYPSSYLVYLLVQSPWRKLAGSSRSMSKLDFVGSGWSKSAY